MKNGSFPFVPPSLVGVYFLHPKTHVQNLYKLISYVMARALYLGAQNVLRSTNGNIATRLILKLALANLKRSILSGQIYGTLFANIRYICGCNNPPTGEVWPRIGRMERHPTTHQR